MRLNKACFVVSWYLAASEATASTLSSKLMLEEEKGEEEVVEEELIATLRDLYVLGWRERYRIQSNPTSLYCKQPSATGSYTKRSIDQSQLPPQPSNGLQQSSGYGDRIAKLLNVAQHPTLQRSSFRVPPVDTSGL